MAKEKAKVTSSLISNHEYRNGKIWIQFPNGSEWEYEADRKCYDEFCNAESLGKHFHTKIKGLPGKKIEKK